MAYHPNLNDLDGLTGNIQDQLDSIDVSSLETDIETISGSLDDYTLLTTTETVSGNLQDSIDDKADISGAQTFYGGQRGGITTLSYSSSIEIDFSVNNNFVVTLSGNLTFSNPTGLVSGQSGIIECIQDSTGSRILDFGTNWKFTDGNKVVLSTGANAKDLLAYYIDSSGDPVIGMSQNNYS